MHHRPPASTAHIPELDGARGLACLLILVYHYACCQLSPAPGTALALALRPFSLSWSGVDLFFVLSGFLLGGILLDHREASNLLRVFYVRRACRIFPIYFAWLGLFVVLPLLFGRSGPFAELFDDRLPAWSYATFLQNFVMAWRNDFGPKWLDVTWSLAVEEQFYLLLPALILFTPVRRLPWLLAGLILAAPVCRTVIMGSFPEHFLAPYVLLPCRWDALFLGVLGAWAVRRPAWGEHPARVRRWLYVLVGLLGVGVVALGRWWPSPIAPVMVEAGYTWIALFYLVVLLLAQVSPLLSYLFRLRLLVFFGAISYGAYLFHEGIGGLLHGLIRGAPAKMDDSRGLAVTALALGLTVVFAWASYRWVETPALRWGRRWQYGRTNDVRDAGQSRRDPP